MSAKDMQINSELKMGKFVLKNRVCLAPLTRGRADPKTNVPNSTIATYYEQRAGGGLLVSEATGVSAQGLGWFGAPGIYNQAQCDAWKESTEKVHAAKGILFCQLWHMGRQSHSSYHPDTKEIVSASALAREGEVTTFDQKKAPYEVPRALRLDEMKGVVEQYRSAAEFAKKAGFDGVEIHSANGYLLDQFLQSCSNKRTDKYGGSMENRARLLIEVVEAVLTVFDSDSVAVRLSPNGAFGSMGSADNVEMFTYVATQLAKYKLGYLHLMDQGFFGANDKGKHVTMHEIRKVYPGIIMGNVGLTRDTAEGMLRAGVMDLAAFGRPYIANPDLAERYLNDWPLAAEAPYPTWWTNDLGAKGYTDFPAYDPKSAAAGTAAEIQSLKETVAKLEAELKAAKKAGKASA